MFALIWGAVRTRTAQVLTVLALTTIATAVAAAGPWFGYASITRASAANVADAPAEQRIVSVRQIADTRGDPQAALDQLASAVRGRLPLAPPDPITGAVLPLTVNLGGETATMAIATRDDFCGHVRLAGRCPDQPSQVAVSDASAQQLGLDAGDTLVMRATPSSEPITVEIVARYTLTDPSGVYWSNPLFEAESGLEPAFTPLATFQARQLWEPTLSYDLQVPDTLIRGDGGYRLGAVLRDADARLAVDDLRLVNLTGPLLDTIARNRAEIRLGVAVAMAQILVLAWFAIGLAGRYTGRDRRGDAALLKLRGSTRGGMLRLAWGQHLVPLSAGAVLGLPLGWLLARLLAGPVGTAADREAALLLSLAAAGAVLAGGLLVLAAVEGLVLRLPVVALLRQTGAGRGDWRAGLADLLLLAVAVAAVYQARSSAPDSGLALVAPALVALAVAMLLALLLDRVADRGGGAAVRTGRLRLGLTAVQVSRQPGSDRVFALLVVAVALFATTLGAWRADGTAREERSESSLGAARVLGVETANRTSLQRAVRQADPGGTKAMAAVVDPTLLAVDTSRLAAVTGLRLPIPAATADPLPRVTGGRVTARLRYDGVAPSALALVLQNDATGAPVTVSFGTLARGEQTRSAPVPGCTAEPGCRVVRWQLTTPPDANGRSSPAAPGSAVTVRGLTQTGPDAVVLDAARLGDIAHWRPGTAGAALDIAARDGALRLAVDDNNAELPSVGVQVYAVDTPLPLPVVLAGPTPQQWQLAEPSITTLGGSPVPVRVVGTVPVLPVLGRAGVLADLEATRLIAADANPAGRFQVWLAPGAGEGTVDALRRAGLVISSDDSAGRRADRLGEQAPAAVARFALLAVGAALLLAAATVAVAGAVDRRTRLDQLRALRVQGLADRVAVVTAYAGPAVLIGAGLVTGLIAAAVAVPLARAALPGFTDGWDVLPPPYPLGVASLALAGLLALAVLGLTAWLSVLPLVRGLRFRELGR
ncbi:FtsX-like permease family protein [Paractinoplanes deccanensis]|uniref:FtsX-like permease family protein n=1 Tax=Paractinoplanes deccanensis TaxID=113561 RepID=UPI003608434B